jgi:hypothetical protein
LAASLSKKGELPKVSAYLWSFWGTWRFAPGWSSELMLKGIWT